jgi:hypothetical protein
MSRRQTVELLYEPSTIFATPVDELSGVIPIGSVTHLIFSVRQHCSTSGEIERIVRVRLIVPTDQINKIGRLVLSGRVDLVSGFDECMAPVELH